MNSFPVLQRINKEGNYFEPSRCLYSITTFSFNVLPLFSAQRIMHPVDGALVRFIVFFFFLLILQCILFLLLRISFP